MRVDDEQSAREALGLDEDDEERLPFESRPSFDWLAWTLIGLIVLVAAVCAWGGWSLGGR